MVRTVDSKYWLMQSERIFLAFEKTIIAILNNLQFPGSSSNIPMEPDSVKVPNPLILV